MLIDEGPLAPTVSRARSGDRTLPGGGEGVSGATERVGSQGRGQKDRQGSRGLKVRGGSRGLKDYQSGFPRKDLEQDSPEKVTARISQKLVNRAMRSGVRDRALRVRDTRWVGTSVRVWTMRPLVDDSETTRDDRFFRNVFVNDSRFDIP